MSWTEKTAPGVASIEGGAGNRISGQAIGDPDSDSTTFGHKPQGIADLLPCGAENAISTKALVRLTGCSSARQLQGRISAERAQGAVILSSSTGGYFLPAAGAKGRREIKEYIATLQARSQNTLRAVESAKEALDEMEQGVSGKGRLECGQT